MAIRRLPDMDTLVALCKRRGFVFPGSEIYGGLANSWDYGPLGVELRNNIRQLWWDRFVRQRPDMVGLESAILMNSKVWEASGHTKTFSDPLVECRNCNGRFRADQIGEPDGDGWKLPDCPNCSKHDWTEAREFNLMLETHLGPVNLLKSINDIFKLLADLFKETIKEMALGVASLTQASPDSSLLAKKSVIDSLVQSLDKAEKNIENAIPRAKQLGDEINESKVNLRPETAQGMFVDFKNILDTSRVKMPFGIAQVGKAFRNEITPGNFIFRTREFEQMEIEYFIMPPQSDSDWELAFEHWRKEMHDWVELLGLDPEKVHELEVEKDDLAHYSKRTIDLEYDYPFGRKELYGLAYRTDFDLKNHYPEKGPYLVAETGEHVWPHVIEPTWGVDRTLLAVLCDAYREDEEGKRVWLQVKPSLAPFKAAVFPLLANKPELVTYAQSLYGNLLKEFPVAWDDRGNVGKRYFAQDEIGTPWCVTVDFQTLEDGTVTIRNRDTAEQERVPASELAERIRASLI